VVLAKTYEPGVVMVFRPKMTPGLDVLSPPASI
jgi:hypothetical protein